nr:hypothetical protein GCM10025732_46960 [Glycomyces mayteni]
MLVLVHERAHVLEVRGAEDPVLVPAAAAGVVLEGEALDRGGDGEREPVLDGPAVELGAQPRFAVAGVRVAHERGDRGGAARVGLPGEERLRRVGVLGVLLARQRDPHLLGAGVDLPPQLLPRLRVEDDGLPGPASPPRHRPRGPSGRHFQRVFLGRNVISHMNPSSLRGSVPREYAAGATAPLEQAAPRGSCAGAGR